MPESTTDERGFIAFSKYAKGGYWTTYENLTLHVVKEAIPGGKTVNWNAYEVTVSTGREEYVAGGPSRRQAAVNAMDEIDGKDPSKPLRTKEQAAGWVKALTKAYPAALEFVAVRDETGKVLGWTFFVEEDGEYRFGWVAVDRRRSQALEDARDQAARLLVATVGTPSAESPALSAPPQGCGGLVPAPVREVEAVDGGTSGGRQLPTYANGMVLLGINGRRHQVWRTSWREEGGVKVETVVSTTGGEYRVDRLAPLPGRVETDAHKGGTAAERSPVLGGRPLKEVCPEGHMDLVAAAQALERFRSGPEGERVQAEAAAEEYALWAAAKFRYTTGELTIDLWRMVVRCGVQLHARRFSFGRPYAVDTVPEGNGFFGAGRRSLEDRSPDGFREMLDAARHLVDSGHNPVAKAERGVKYAAYGFAALGGERKHWETAVRYLVELYAATLLEEAAWRLYGGGAEEPPQAPGSGAQEAGGLAASPAEEGVTPGSLSRFYATPAEVDAFLRERLAEDAYLRYQQVIGAAAVREAANGLRDQAEQDRERAAGNGELGSAAEDAALVLDGAADELDPDHDGGPWPSVLVRRFGPGDGADQEALKRGALRAHGRCDAPAVRGRRTGACDAPLDSLGRCTRAGGHVAEASSGAPAGDAG